jgi:hypothetical protein
MVRRYLGYGADEWDALPWHVRRVYLEGLEQDESVPLQFERQDQEGAQPMPEGVQQRKAEVASVVDITGMIADLEASSGHKRR